MKRAWLLPALLVLTASVRADVKPHELFTDNMVLQAGREIPVWGTATPGEEVTVELQLGKDVIKAGPVAAGKDGRWMVRLPAQVPLRDDTAALNLTIKGVNEITLKNVLIGEVWICSGQSNMEWPVAASFEPKTTIAAAGDAQLRLYTVPKTVSLTPLHNMAQAPKWQECSPQTVPGFSAVAYYFGQYLREKLKVPVGLIHTSWGGTPAQSWTSKDALNAEPALQHYHTTLDRILKDYDPQKAEEKYRADMENWREAADRAKAEGKQPPRAPQKQQRVTAFSPSALYNAMIAPLIPYAIQGAIWYQGESNAGQAFEYRTLFPTMISDWRKNWNQGEFPFLFVQLAPFMKIESEPKESAWAELREAQMLTTKALPKAGMAVITDVGDEKDIHPKKKQPVGQRLALAALALAYDQKIEFTGPAYTSMKSEGNKAVLTFVHANGLEARGGELTGFTICGEDRKFHNAKAEIAGPNTVAVFSEAVANPTAVRFGWANYPVVNLWNKAGLPASPFRTDDFPVTTQPKK
jgi:sialate O-acetylesterase